MSTFGRATYNAARYAAIRPTYPRQLFDFVFRFHERNPQARFGLAVDLGCGTGQATAELTPFQRIIGVEPSAKMVEQAKLQAQNTALQGQLDYVQSSAESLPFIEDGSVDLIVSAQAAHWFDWSKLWVEAARVLRKGGSMAVWGYSEFRLSNYAGATPLIQQYSQGSDPVNSIGPYWEQPGRSIVDNHLQDIPDPSSVVSGAFEDFERVYFTGSHHAGLPSPRPVILRKTMSWDDLLAYFRTFSSLHSYHELHPEDLKREDGDIAVRFLERLKALVESEAGAVGDTVDVEWPLALLLARRA